MALRFGRSSGCALSLYRWGRGDLNAIRIALQYDVNPALVEGALPSVRPYPRLSSIRANSADLSASRRRPPAGISLESKPLRAILHAMGKGRVLVLDDEPRILDIVLGPESGYEVAGRLKKIPRASGLPVLFMSSRVGMSDLFLKNYQGRADFIQKPFKKDDLISRLSALVSASGGRAAAAPRAPRRRRRS
jgi:CheY-like chemotaxis protein